MALATILTTAAVLSIFLLVFKSRQNRPKGTTLPPGPPGYFLVGNIPDLPAQNLWVKFFEWGRQYGPLIRLNLMGSRHYVISTNQVANDLLRDRGNIYSSRLQTPAAKLVTNGMQPLIWPYDRVFREGRKLTRSFLEEKASLGVQPAQTTESCRLVEDLIREPDEYIEWFDRYAAGVMFRKAFGKTIRSTQDRRVKDMNEALWNFGYAITPGNYLCDTLPFLAKLPTWLTPFKKDLMAKSEWQLKLMKDFLRDIEVEASKGEAVDCWEKTYLDHKDGYDLTEDQGVFLVGSTYQAGAHTTSAAMQSWLLAAVLYPLELKKLQNELDEVVGDERLPTFEDMPNLPRARAHITEVLRWRPVTAGGIPHYTTKDDVYNGMFVPAGTIVHPNIWAIQREPEQYPDAENFVPDRWLDSKFPTYREPLTQFPTVKHFSAFDYGRRMCPGMYIAEKSLFIEIARIAWACNIGKKIGPDGKEIEVPFYDYQNMVNGPPKKFAFSLTARSEKHRAIVQHAVEEAEANDPLKGRYSD